VSVDRSALPAVGPDRAFRLAKPRTHRLGNRLRTWTVEHRGLPVVATLLIVPAGSATDPVDRPGLAALTADLLDEGAGDNDALGLHDALARIGAHLDTECTADATVVGVLSLAQHAEAAMRLLADVFTRPHLTDRDFGRLRTLRRNRLTQLRDVPGALADRLFVETLFRGHPYGHLAIGSEESLDSVTRDEVVGFHRRWFGPERATLVVVGDLSHDEAFDIAARAFGDGAGNGARKPSPGDVAPAGAASAPAREVVLIDRPGAQQSELRIGRVGAARSTAGYHAMVVANAVLGGQFTSRINMNLREDKGFTYGARSYFDFRREPGPFAVQASVQADATAASIREVFAELDGLRQARPVTGRELDLARWGLTRGYARNFETSEQVARAMAQLILHALPDDSFDTFVDAVRAVDGDAVSEVAGRLFDPASMLAVVVGDRERIGPGLHELGFERCTVIPDPRGS
jgi:predicted Zn-dependent peptidase